MMATTMRMPSMPISLPFTPIVDENPAEFSAQPLVAEQFDPNKHLNFKPPESIIYMKDIGYADDTGVSPVAVSQPFHLFSMEAVQQMRNEVLNNPKVSEEHAFNSNIAARQVRGYVEKYAPFSYDAWTHPDTLAILSRIAGIELVPEMNYEIGHINFSVKSETQTAKECAEIETQKQAYASDEGISGCPWEDDKPVVGWHTDSYPFVCVLMLSDCTNMVGGETVIRTGNGDILKVRGPQMGCAVMLQGRYIMHQALRALGARERITSVTSFRPKLAQLDDDTVLTSVRPISDLSQLYYEFSEYRLEIMEERIRVKLKELRVARNAGKRMDTKGMKTFLERQKTFLGHTNHEIVEEDKVSRGYLTKLEFPDVGVGIAGVELDTPPPKRTRNV